MRSKLAHYRIFTDSDAILLIVLSVSKDLTVNLSGVPLAQKQIHSVRCRFRMALNTMNLHPSYRPMQVAVIDVFVHIDR